MSKKFLGIAFVFVMLMLTSMVAVAQEAPDYVDPCLVEDTEQTEAAVEAPDNSAISFHIILPNPRGDRSFIDSAAAGADRAIAELGVTGVIVETAGVQEHDSAMRRAVQADPNLVITIAVDGSTVEEVVDEFPDQLFAAQETFFAAPPEYENLALFNIFTHENSYLAGIAAGMLTRTGRVGAVGGGDFPGINMFIYGYEDGVRSVCPDCEIVTSYVGGSNAFSDPVRGKEIALGMYEDGVDIIYQVAGRSGEGVLEAAFETGNFAIGVDSNQDELYPGTIILSAMKRVDNAVFTFVESVVNDTYTPGESVGGMAEGFAGLSWDVGICSRTFDEFGPEDMVAELPAVRLAIEEARAQILAGELVIRNALTDTP